MEKIGNPKLEIRNQLETPNPKAENHNVVWISGLRLAMTRAARDAGG